jgi:hypothetical protein
MPRQSNADTASGRTAILWAGVLGVLVVAGALVAVFLTADATGTAPRGRESAGTQVTTASRAAEPARDAVSPPHAFSIAGRVGGLVPGETAALVLTVSNRERVAINVTSITTTVGDASSRCRGTNVRVAPFAGDLSIPAGATGRATVAVTLIHSAADACQGATFRFAYRGLARVP